MTPLTQGLIETGAILDASSRPLHFGDPAKELVAALESCILADRSDLGRILATGPDVLDLLHRLTTADLQGLEESEGSPAVLTTPKGRIVQRIFVHHLGGAGILLVTGPSGAEKTRSHLDRFTFQEKTGLSVVTEDWSHLVLSGPLAGNAASAAGLPSLEGHGSSIAEVGGVKAHVLGGDGLSKEGVSVVVPGEGAGEVWKALSEAVAGVGGRVAGDQAIQARRVLQGLPENGFELTEDHNPLEAGLWDAVSFTKGCYVGQEVVARLNTYDKVARDLKGIVFPEASPVPAPGTPLYDGLQQVGKITSALVPPGRTAPVAMAYVKKGSSETGTRLSVGSGEGPETVALSDLPLGETP